MGIIKKIAEIEIKNKANKTEMDKLIAGKKTLKSIFKTQGKKEATVQNI